MTTPSRGKSPIDRQERRERAQKAALTELEAQAECQRENSDKLRKLRLEKTKGNALNFKSWRELQS